MMQGHDLYGKTLGIVGCGRIGRAVARRGIGFGMRVVYTDAVRLPGNVEAELRVEWRELQELLRDSDVVSVHAPLTPQTRHLFGAEAFRMMKPTAVTLLPHLGSATIETRTAMGLLAVDNLLTGLAGQRPRCLVNPEVLNL